MKTFLRAGLLFAALLFLAGTGYAIFDLADPPVRLRDVVAENMDDSGVGHPVTAVLLNFRGYDTLLEIAVLMLAVIGVLTTTGGERDFGVRLAGKPQALLQSVTRLVTPLMVLIAGYLLWAGAHQPGGAFQGGAVLAAAAVLLYLSGLTPVWSEPGKALRLGLAAGFLLFLGVAAALLWQGALLQFPGGAAKHLILLIEGGLLVSLGLMLAGLFLWQPNESEEPEE